jgi:hypothetical protein
MRPHRYNTLLGSEINYPAQPAHRGHMVWDFVREQGTHLVGVLAPLRSGTESSRVSVVSLEAT